MSSSAPLRPSLRSRLALLVAAAATFVALAVTMPSAQAGYYEDGGYGSPCGYRCGYRYNPCGYRCGYRYEPYRYGGCLRCYPYVRRRYVYDHYIEHEHIESSYSGPPHHCCRRYGYDYGYYDNPYRPYRRYSYWARPFPYGYGGVRDEPEPYEYERLGY